MAVPALPSPQEAKSKATTIETIKPSSASPSSSDHCTMDYLSTKHSPSYTLAKSKLSSGELDECLSLIEGQLADVKSSLVANDNADKVGDELELHEALCPLYYLYGTTLLYLVDENESMMNNSGGDKPVPAPEQDNEEGEAPEGEEEEVQPDPTEDLQIAWENLDIARTILSRLVESFDPTTAAVDSTTISLKTEEGKESYTEEQQRELLLDLAQIHTRLGDVQRANGATSAVDDYTTSLEIRRAVLGKFDKLVADNHYCLAQAYGEAPSKEKEREDGALGIVAALSGGGVREQPSESSDGMSKEEIAECLIKSIDHYLACGVSFAGYLANMCGKDAVELTTVEENVSSSAAAAAASTDGNNGSSTHSKTLEVIRQRVAVLTPLDEADIDRFNDTKEILDEIQETLDTAEGSEEALKAVHAMKENEIRKHSGKGGEEAVDESGATTTIGFGAASASVAAAASTTTTIGFGTAGSNVAAAPMMVVKKKKKIAANDGGAAAKRAKAE